MRRIGGGGPQRRMALAVIAALALNPSVMMASGPPVAPPAAAIGSSLVIESDPPDAAVYVDGQPTGQTPMQVAGLTPGDHRLRLVKDGYLENARLVAVGTATSTVRVPLTRDPASTSALAAQVSSGGGGESKKWLWIGLAGGGAAGAAVGATVLAKSGSSSSTPASSTLTAGAFLAAPITAIVATVTTFTDTGASDPAGRVLNYAWDFGDGGIGNGVSSTHTYTAAGTFVVKLTVTAGSDSVSITNTQIVRSLAATWTGTYAPFGTTVFNSSIVLAQTGTTLTGIYDDQFSGNHATVSGTVDATTGQVALTMTLTIGPAQWAFTGAPSADAKTLTGNVSNISVGGILTGPWTMSHP